MHSELIEYFRFDDLETGILMNGKKYILSHKDCPVKEVSTPVKHVVLLKELHKYLRYNATVSNEEKWSLIRSFSDTIKAFFIDLDQLNNIEAQLDLVLNASELGLLPFELILNQDDIPVFANEERKLVLTRRIRQGFIGSEEIWPLSPKVLFISVNPNYGNFAEVPHKLHLYALDWALKPWGGKENPNVLTVIEDATFQNFSDTLKEADQAGKPFTHIHILAHGKLILDVENPFDSEYGIAFVSDKKEATKIDQIRNLFQGLKKKPFFVNYMVCDGANFSNPLQADKNPVQVTHRAGVPIVIGSQFPLSVEGTNIITERLYNDLFKGVDIREILFQIRKALYSSNSGDHDWISLVSYVRLPEGYENYLLDLSLKIQLTHLTAIRQKTDRLITNAAPSKDDFEEIFFDLKSSIDALQLQMEKIKDKGKQEQVYLENAGLIGSVYKRLAELMFYKSKLINNDPKQSLDEQREYLQEASAWYKKASDQNLSHHWSIIQFLSLEVVLNGSISNLDYWFAARQSIHNALQDTHEIWANGSLLELYLLTDKNLVPDARENIRRALQDLIVRSEKKKDHFPVESTLYQLNRYLLWWTNDNGYAINKNLWVSDHSFLNRLSRQLKDSIN